MGAYGLAKKQSGSANAQQRMKQIDPDFNLWELEEDAKGIFLNAYNQFLLGDLSQLELICSE